MNLGKVPIIPSPGREQTISAVIELIGLGGQGVGPLILCGLPLEIILAPIGLILGRIFSDVLEKQQKQIKVDGSMIGLLA